MKICEFSLCLNLESNSRILFLEEALVKRRDQSHVPIGITSNYGDYGEIASYEFKFSENTPVYRG